MAGAREARAPAVRVLTLDEERFRVLEFGGGVYLVDEVAGVSRQIGTYGRRIWRLLKDGESVDQAASIVAAETGARLAVVLEDTRRFVRDLIDAGVIVEGTS